ncbi:hypothetical protein ACHAXT_013003 [Thalassiosira profunda]
MPRQVPVSQLKRPLAPHHHPRGSPGADGHPQQFGGGPPQHYGGHPHYVHPQVHPQGQLPPVDYHRQGGHAPAGPPYLGAGSRSLSSVAEGDGGRVGGEFPLPPSPTQQQQQQRQQQHGGQPHQHGPPQQGAPEQREATADDFQPLEARGRRHPARARKRSQEAGGADATNDTPNTDGAPTNNDGALPTNGSDERERGPHIQRKGSAFEPLPAQPRHRVYHQHPQHQTQPSGRPSDSGSWEHYGSPRQQYPPQYGPPPPYPPQYYPQQQYTQGPYQGGHPAYNPPQGQPYHTHRKPEEAPPGYQEFVPPPAQYGPPPPGPPGPMPPPPTGMAAAAEGGRSENYGPPPGYAVHPMPHPVPMAGPPGAVPPMAGPPPNASYPTTAQQADALEDIHLPPSEVLPPYKYSTAHKDRTWDEMVELFNGFVEKEGHGDVERDDPSLVGGVAGGAASGDDAKGEEAGQAGNKAGGGKAANKRAKKSRGGKRSDAKSSTGTDPSDDDENLTLRSWVREVRWVVRAAGYGQDDAPPQRCTKPSTAKRCDSETVTPERLRQLEALPHFPLHRRPGGTGSLAGSGGVAGSAFQRWIDDLAHFRAKNGGDCNVPLKYADYPGLGNFVNRQRTEFRKLQQGKSSSMTRSKIRQLDSVGFVWSVRAGGHAPWETRLSELAEYRRVHGHTNVPKKCADNPPLGYWVNEQRFQYQKMMIGKPSYMTHAKAARMDALGFQWRLRDGKRQWGEWISALEEYKAEHGHVDVPLKYAKNAQLGGWVNNQRSEYRRFRRNKGETTGMTEERVKELEGMGFRWTVRESRTPWSQRFEELKAHKKQRGDCNVPNNWPDNQPLAAWVAKQRSQYRLYERGSNSGLTEDRVKQLEELGFDWKYPAAKVPVHVGISDAAAREGAGMTVKV